jgi:rod shape-determining protein MreD
MKYIIAIVISFLVAILLQIVPLPHWLELLRPEWILLVLIFWALVMPSRVGVGIAFCLGIYSDFLKADLLGSNALIYVIVTYFVIKFSTRIRLFPRWQQSAVVFVLILFYEGVQFWIHGMLGELPGTWLYWLPSITSALVWPWIYAILKPHRQRMRMMV